MARLKGSKNKVTVTLPDECNLLPEQRIELLANLIIDRILEDQIDDQKLLKEIGDSHGTRSTATA